jgi:hypothetical protein
MPKKKERDLAKRSLFCNFRGLHRFATKRPFWITCAQLERQLEQLLLEQLLPEQQLQ